MFPYYSQKSTWQKYFSHYSRPFYRQFSDLYSQDLLTVFPLMQFKCTRKQGNVLIQTLGDPKGQHEHALREFTK